MRHRALVLALLLAPASAAADGTIVFARAGALWERAAGGTAEEVKLVDLPAGAVVRFVEAGGDGKLVVLDLGGSSAWLVRGEETPALRNACDGRARPSPKAECVVCRGASEISLVAATRDTRATLAIEAREIQFQGDGGTELALLRDDGVFAVDRRTPEKERRLADKGPRSHFLVSPDGTRGVAVFGDARASRIKAFVLDGKGVGRVLGGPGVPVVWSADSEWVLTQEGIDPDEEQGDDDNGDGEAEADRVDPWVVAAPKKKAKPKPKPPEPKAPTTRACAVRATGGETKCWDDYEGLAFSPDSTLVLLKRGTTLYTGKIAGVRPEPPAKLFDDVEGAATWVAR